MENIHCVLRDEMASVHSHTVTYNVTFSGIENTYPVTLTIPVASVGTRVQVLVLAIRSFGLRSVLMELEETELDLTQPETWAPSFVGPEASSGGDKNQNEGQLEEAVPSLMQGDMSLMGNIEGEALNPNPSPEDDDPQIAVASLTQLENIEKDGSDADQPEEDGDPTVALSSPLHIQIPQLENSAEPDELVTNESTEEEDLEVVMPSFLHMQIPQLENSEGNGLTTNESTEEDGPEVPIQSILHVLIPQLENNDGGGFDTDQLPEEAIPRIFITDIPQLVGNEPHGINVDQLANNPTTVPAEVDQSDERRTTTDNGLDDNITLNSNLSSSPQEIIISDAPRQEMTHPSDHTQLEIPRFLPDAEALDTPELHNEINTDFVTAADTPHVPPRDDNTQEIPRLPSEAQVLGTPQLHDDGDTDSILVAANSQDGITAVAEQISSTVSGDSLRESSSPNDGIRTGDARIRKRSAVRLREETTTTSDGRIPNDDIHIDYDYYILESPPIFVLPPPPIPDIAEPTTTVNTLIAMFMGPTWGPSGADRT